MSLNKSDKIHPDNVIKIDLENLIGNEDTIGKEIIDKLNNFDRQVREYYLSLHNRSTQIFNEFLNLFSILMVSINHEIPGFVLKFKTGSQVQTLVAASASGSLRNLRVAYKLLLDGYFAEMHATLRMVEQWLECLVVVEGNPSAAPNILQKGISSKHVQEALKSSKELKNLYAAMQKSFSKLSQRAHVTKIALDLSRMKEPKEAFFISSVISEEMFCKDSLALATMAMNSLNVLLRHFQIIPDNWLKKFNEARNNLRELTGTSANNRLKD
jgi:hypothetical protein